MEVTDENPIDAEIRPSLGWDWQRVAVFFGLAQVARKSRQTNVRVLLHLREWKRHQLSSVEPATGSETSDVPAIHGAGQLAKQPHPVHAQLHHIAIGIDHAAAPCDAVRQWLATCCAETEEERREHDRTLSSSHETWHSPAIPKRASMPKRPRDPIQLAKLIGDIATGQVDDRVADSPKVARARKGGSKGGPARASARPRA